MLLFFKVSNFRSINEEVSLNFESEAYKEHPESQVSFNGKNYNKIFAMYGPNASGKSNFILAFTVIKNMIEDGARITIKKPLQYLPFLYADRSGKPTSMEIGFVNNGIRYRYGFSYTQTAIITEHLYYAPKGREVMVFERNDGVYKFGSDEAVLKDLTPKNIENKLFLVTASQWNYEIASEVINALLDDVYVVIENDELYGKRHSSLESFAFEPIIKDEEYKKFLISMLQAADLNVSDITVKRERGFNPDFSRFIYTDAQEIDLSFIHYYKATLTHIVCGKNYALPLDLESDGTKRLLSLAHLFYESFNHDKVLIMDELDASLHPSILSFLIKSFLDNSHKGSQLIFTSHNTSIMSDDYFRRDQIYFFDKNDKCSTELFPLSSFGPRKNNKYERDYLLGRYGAIPAVVSFLKEK